MDMGVVGRVPDWGAVSLQLGAEPHTPVNAAGRLVFVSDGRSAHPHTSTQPLTRTHSILASQL